MKPVARTVTASTLRRTSTRAVSTHTGSRRRSLARRTIAATTQPSRTAAAIKPDTDPITAALDLTTSNKPIRLINAIDDKAERAIAKALGQELRRTREEHGWSRADLVALLPSTIGDRTLLAYEHGTRHLTVIRLVELAECLQVAAPDLLTLALQRARLHLEHLVLQIDLPALLGDRNVRYSAMHRWARRKLAENPSGIGELHPAALRELASYLDYSSEELADYLATFTPSTALQSE